MKATVKYASGLMLVISKYKNQPMLFLEWLATKNAGKMPLHKVINDEDSRDNGILKIRMNLPREEYNECAEYINLNCEVEYIA